MLSDDIPAGWRAALADHVDTTSFRELSRCLAVERARTDSVIYPPEPAPRRHRSIRVAGPRWRSRLRRVAPVRVAEAGLKIHPARFPVQLPEWFIRFLTDPGDTVLDIFGGSMTTGWAAERMGREWIGIEIVPQYVAASRLRFFGDEGALLADEYRAQPSLVPVIDISPDDGGVDAGVPELTRSEIRPAS